MSTIIFVFLFLQCIQDNNIIKYKLINYYIKLMKFLVTTEVFETIHKEEDLRRQAELVKSQINSSFLNYLMILDQFR